MAYINVSGGNPPGFQWGFVAAAATVNIVSTAEATGTAIVTLPAIVFDGAPIILHFFCPHVTTESVLTDNVTLSFFEGATQLGRAAVIRTAAASSTFLPVKLEYQFTPTAASHTYGVTAFATATTGTPAANAGAAGTATLTGMFIRATKV